MKKKKKHTVYWNFWDSAKPVLRGKCMIINDYIIKEEQYQINSLTLNFIDVEKERTKLS